MGLKIIPCDLGLYEPISFLIGGHWFEIRPETYVMSVENNGVKMCVLGFGSIAKIEMFIFGNVFLREYYTIWDME